MHTEITGFAEPIASTNPGGLQCPFIYRNELDFNVSEIAMKEMQDAVDGAGLNGQEKIY